MSANELTVRQALQLPLAKVSNGPTGALNNLVKRIIC